MNKITVWKRLLYILITVLIIFVVGYLVFTGGNLE